MSKTDDTGLTRVWTVSRKGKGPKSKIICEYIPNPVVDPPRRCSSCLHWHELRAEIGLCSYQPAKAFWQADHRKGATNWNEGTGCAAWERTPLKFITGNIRIEYDRADKKAKKK